MVRWCWVNFQFRGVLQFWPGRVAQSVGHLTRKSGVLGSIPGLATYFRFSFRFLGWSGGAKVLGKLPVPGRPTILITVGQGPTALAVGAGGGCLDIFTLIYPFSSLSPSLWETARYRLKYCLKGPLNPKQPTNQPSAFPRRAVVSYWRKYVNEVLVNRLGGLSLP